MFKSAQGDLNGFLDEGSHLKGELHFEDTFKVSGKVTGSILSDKGNLEIYESGEIDGEIGAHEVIVSGTVRGDLRSTGRIEITATGKVYADVSTPSLVIREGAFFEGRCSMQSASKSASKPVSAVGDRRNVTPMPMAKDR